MASGLIEYLAEGTSTKRMHPVGRRKPGCARVELARAGFDGPRTVWEGAHGLLHGFANTLEGDWDKLIGDFGDRWVAAGIAFKPYACGTMIHPYIDCARKISVSLGRGSSDIVAIECDTAEGYVHRLWEPLEAKRHPATAYAAKFSIPYCVAYALLGWGTWGSTPSPRRTHAMRLSRRLPRAWPTASIPPPLSGRVHRPRARALRRWQPDRGAPAAPARGRREPLSRGDIEEKFRANCAHGGWEAARADAWLAFARPRLRRAHRPSSLQGVKP